MKLLNQKLLNRSFQCIEISVLFVFWTW